MLTIKSVEEFLQNITFPLGTSDWLIIDQKRINLFADATLDHQWIHIDENKAKIESPLGTTIAHGYLLISLIPHFLDQIFKVENLERIVNYGIYKVIFQTPVPVNSRLRMKAYLESAKDLGNICYTNIKCIFEMEGNQEPVLEGHIKYLYYFKYNTITNN